VFHISHFITRFKLIRQQLQSEKSGVKGCTEFVRDVTYVRFLGLQQSHLKKENDGILREEFRGQLKEEKRNAMKG
jgi:hypothetical protein